MFIPEDVRMDGLPAIEIFVPRVFSITRCYHDLYEKAIQLLKIYVYHVK
jgi:hypothetical protein